MSAESPPRAMRNASSVGPMRGAGGRVSDGRSETLPCSGRASVARLRRVAGYELLDRVGSGGVGKTALVTEVVHELEPDFDRVVVVELADGSHDGDTARLIADAVIDEPARDMDRVADALYGRS